MHLRNLACLPLLAGLLATVACTDLQQPPQGPELASTSAPVVYGEDNRRDVYDHPDEAWRALARRSIVAMVPLNRLDASDPDNIQIEGSTLGESQGLCDDQRFRDHPRVSNCSATLIDDDLVLTAGHCIEDQEECEGVFYVFDAIFEAEGQLATISQDEVYTCQRLISVDPGGDFDHAIIQLDRPVTGDHGPAPVRAIDEALEIDQEVVLIGFPNGIPAKIADGGHVVNNRPNSLDFFEATVDAFGGNSGSGVFDADGNVVGILVRGEQDYRRRGDCNVVNVIDEETVTPEDGAEDITYVARAVESLCAQGFPSQRLCGGDDRGLCFSCEEDGQCRDGWSCRTWPDNPEVSFCAPPCQTDDQCRSDHACDVDSGFCQPRLSNQCREGQPWSVDACGRDVAALEPCGAEQLCQRGACVDRGPGDTCDAPEAIDPVSQTITGDLSVGYSSTRRGTCAGNGPERIFAFTLEAPQAFRATATGFDTVLHMRSQCDEQDTEIACVDDSDPPGRRGSQIERNLDPGQYFLMMDSFGRAGEYTLELDFGPICNENPCEVGVAFCDGDGNARQCLADERGCPVVGEAEICGQEGICIDGACLNEGDGNRCEEATPIDPVTQVIEGSVAEGYTNNHQGSCGGDGPEHVFTFTVERLTRFQALSEGYDTVLYLRAGCERDAEVACNDDIDRRNDVFGSRLVETLEAGTYFLFMDAFRATADPYTLVLAFEPVCPDGCPLEGQSICVEGGVMTCQRDVAGCLDWSMPVACGAEQICRAGQCQAACEDQCAVAGERICTGEGDYQLCGVGPEGCLVLSPPRACIGGGRCVDDGQCVNDEPNNDVNNDANNDPNNDPGEDPDGEVITSSPDDGCGCVTPPTRPATPTPAALLLLLGLAVLIRRRR